MNVTLSGIHNLNHFPGRNNVVYIWIVFFVAGHEIGIQGSRLHCNQVNRGIVHVRQDDRFRFRFEAYPIFCEQFHHQGCAFLADFELIATEDFSVLVQQICAVNRCDFLIFDCTQDGHRWGAIILGNQGGDQHIGVYYRIEHIITASWRPLQLLSPH